MAAWREQRSKNMLITRYSQRIPVGIVELERELGYDFNIRLEDDLIWVGARSDLIKQSRRRADGWRRN